MADSEAPSVDLRDFGFMPLDVRRLLTSETWIEAVDDPRIGHAAMSLWCESWHQLPAGSLPDNDKVLYRLSMCPNQKEWARVREAVLRGWCKHDDGRLYHKVVSEKALESWQKKLDQRERTRKATEERERRRRERDEQRYVERDVNRNERRNVTRNESRNDERGHNRDVHQGTGTVKGQGDLKDQKRSASPPVDNSNRRGQIAALLRAAQVQVTSQNPLLVAWVDELRATDAQIAEAVERARIHKPKPQPIPAKYLDTIVRDLVAGGGKKINGNHHTAYPATEAAAKEQGAKLGIEARPGESLEQFQRRVTVALAERKRL